MPIDDQLRVTPPPAEPTQVMLYGGPFGKRPYVLPHAATVGFRIVMLTDARGTKLNRPIVYEVFENDERRGWLARYAGFATDSDVERWKAKQPYAGRS